MAEVEEDFTVSQSEAVLGGHLCTHTKHTHTNTHTASLTGEVRVFEVKIQALL